MPDSPANPPALRAVLYRVVDVDRVAAFYRDGLGFRVEPAPVAGWQEVQLGWDQSLYLAPGGRQAPPLDDRFDHRGIIPIARTFAVDEEAAEVTRLGAQWINPLFDYDMRGHGRIGYFHDPENRPFGIQQRMKDSVREEDLATIDRIRREGIARWLGIGWLIFQVTDLHASRDFYASALSWPELRGTEGFGHMMQIDPYTILQIAFKGIIEDPRRDLAAEPMLPILSTRDVPGLLNAIGAHGGMALPGLERFAAFADPEGHVWLVEPEE
ncbi:MAG: hypothetical protein EPO21_21235 [Chloroflexota bacterium]|nr:MAG: hypothetical protein EPO21_21235 [Chloroflexota bacterium]